MHGEVYGTTITTEFLSSQKRRNERNKAIDERAIQLPATAMLISTNTHTHLYTHAFQYHNQYLCLRLSLNC